MHLRTHLMGIVFGVYWPTLNHVLHEANIYSVFLACYTNDVHFDSYEISNRRDNFPTFEKIFLDQVE